MQKKLRLIVLILFLFGLAFTGEGESPPRSVKVADVYDSYHPATWFVSPQEEDKNDILKGALPETDIMKVTSCYDLHYIRFDVFLYEPILNPESVAYGVTIYPAQKGRDLRQEYVYYCRWKKFSYYKYVNGKKTEASLLTKASGNRAYPGKDKKSICFILKRDTLSKDVFDSKQTLTVSFYSVYYRDKKTAYYADETVKVKVRLSAGAYGTGIYTVAGRPFSKLMYDGGPGRAAFRAPSCLALDKTGNLFIVDGDFIRRLSPKGELKTIAGNNAVAGYREGPGNEVSVKPFGIVTDQAGNLYFADWWYDVIRKITPDGMVTTFCGMPKFEGHVDGPGSKARFEGLEGITIDADGNMYVADIAKDTCSIRKISPTGYVSTIAGPTARGHRDGNISTARFYNPIFLTVDTDKNIYISDDCTVRKITPAGDVTTLAGKFKARGLKDGKGPRARFNFLHGIAVDEEGNVFTADTDNHVIRKITPDGTVSTVAGIPGKAGYKNGPLDTALLDRPWDLILGPKGALFVCDNHSHLIRKIVLK
ncbi:MAG: hypothetical protein P8107_08000 [Spirochaetia bacterium]